MRNSPHRIVSNVIISPYNVLTSPFKYITSVLFFYFLSQCAPMEARSQNQLGRDREAVSICVHVLCIESCSCELFTQVR